MILNESEFLQYFKDNKFTVYYCYEGYFKYENIGTRAPYESQNMSNTHEEALIKVSTLLSRKMGKFSFLCGHKAKQRKDSMNFVQIDTGTQLNVVYDKVQQLEEESDLQGMSKTKFNDAVNLQVTQILAAHEQKKLAEEKDKELENLKSQGGKVAFIVSELIKNLSPGLSTAMQGYQNKSNNTSEPITPTQLENSLGVLVAALSEDVIIKLAKKFKSGEAAMIIPMVKNFANQ